MGTNAPASPVAPAVPPLGAGLVLLVAAASAVTGYFAMFTDFAPWDDAGYVLLGLRQYVDGGILYDQLYSQYGPAYFQLVGTSVSLLGVELTHAVARAVVLGVWVATSAATGVVAHRLTRNIPVALVVQLLTFLVLVPSRNEPMHPSSLLGLAIALAVLASTYVRHGREHGALVAIGALVAFVGLTKANVGLFALAAVGLVLAAATRWRRGARLVTVLAALAVVLLPVTYMTAGLEAGWVRAYAVVTTCSMLAVVVTQLTTVPRALSVRAALLLGGACIAVAAVSCGVALGRGTSPSGLLHGVIVEPLRTPGVLTHPVRLSDWAPAWAVASLAGAALVAGLRHAGRWRGLLAAALDGPVQLLAGAAMWMSAAELLPVTPFTLALPLLWLPLAARPAAAAGDAGIGRAVLIAMAAAQALVAYPIAGSQTAWASYLFVPVAGLAVADGWRGLRALPAPGLWRAARAWRATEKALAVIVVLLALDVAVVMPLDDFRHRYAASELLALHGTGPIRVPPPLADAYRRLTTQLAERCRGFVTMPGLNSLYLFTGVAPPTMLNTTSWMTLFDDARQAEIQRRLAEMPGPLCAVRHRGLVAFWVRGRDVSGVPLARYIDERFVTEFTVNGYEFMVERRSAPAPISARAPTGASSR